MRKTLTLLAALVLFGVAVRADTLDCFSFAADPYTYQAPPGTLIYSDPNSPYTGPFPPGTIAYNEYGMAYTYSFIVHATYTNNCSEMVSIGGSYGTGWDPMLAVYPPGHPAAGYAFMDFNLDAFAIFNPGDWGNYQFEGYLWSDQAPPGYQMTIPIYAEACGEVSGCIFKSTEFMAIVTGPPTPVPEPTTLLLLGTGLFGLAAKRRMTKQKKS